MNWQPKEEKTPAWAVVMDNNRPVAAFEKEADANKWINAKPERTLFTIALGLLGTPKGWKR